MNMRIPKSIWYFIAALTGWRLLLINFLPLIPQEAYYWYYIQYPDWSFFDHPPMTAYSIGLGTWLFGDHFFGVKFMSVIWGGLTNLLLYVTTAAVEYFWPEKKDQKLPIGFGVLVLYNLTVFSHLYSMIAVPDTPLLFFWILSIYLFLQILKSGKSKYWLWLGISLGLGLLSKYTLVALLPAFFLFLLSKKDLRYWLRTPYPYVSILMMMLVFFPVIYWNYRHDWASFSFQFSHRAETLKPFQTKYILQLIASQLFMLTPLVLVLIVHAFYRTFKQWRVNQGLLYFTTTGAFIIFGFLYVSLRSLVKMNWLLPGYLGLLVATGFLFVTPEFWRKFWVKTGVGFSLFLILLVHLIQLIPNLPLGEGNTWSGWQNASQKIYRMQQEMGGRKTCFIFANSYKSASLLKFYLPDHQDTYAQNIYGRPALQFDVWGVPDSLKSKNALYIFDNRREYKNDLQYVKKVFDRVQLVQTYEYRFLDRFPTRTIYCYYAENYHGSDR